jgi:hypothetical protein
VVADEGEDEVDGKGEDERRAEAEGCAGSARLHRRGAAGARLRGAG